MAEFLELDPKETGVDAVDLTATADTKYYTGLLDLRGFSQFVIQLEIVEAGGAAGACKLVYQRYDKHGNTLGSEFNVATAIDSSQSTNAIIVFGGGLVAEALNATIDTDNDRFIDPPGRCKFALMVTTQANGTSSVGSLSILAQ